MSRWACLQLSNDDKGTKGGQPNNKIGIFLVGLAANDIFQKVFVADIDGIMWSDIQPAWEEKVF